MAEQSREEGSARSIFAGTKSAAVAADKTKGREHRNPGPGSPRGRARGLMAPAGASSQGVHRGFTSYQAFPHFLFYKQLLSHMQMTLSTSTLSPERVDASHAWGQILKLPPSTAQESSCPSRACFTGDKTLPHRTPKSAVTNLPKSGFRQKQPERLCCHHDAKPGYLSC